MNKCFADISDNAVVSNCTVMLVETEACLINVQWTTTLGPSDTSSLYWVMPLALGTMVRTHF